MAMISKIKEKKPHTTKATTAKKKEKQKNKTTIQDRRCPLVESCQNRIFVPLWHNAVIWRETVKECDHFLNPDRRSGTFPRVTGKYLRWHRDELTLPNS